MKSIFSLVFFGLLASMIFSPAIPAFAATVYLDGVSPSLASTPGYVVGDHMVSPQPTPSVGGTGGNGISNDGDALNGLRTYTYDLSAQADLTDGIANRGDTNFAMLIWNMGAPFNSMRLYTHQDHLNPNPGPYGIVTDFVAQDVMEYSVWGSNDGNNFVLLSDVTGYNIAGDGVGRPTYIFSGTEPTTVYRGGSAENGVINAYTRDYTFPNSYQYYGVRTSQVSLTIPGGGVDADPEIDAVVGFNACPPGTVGNYPNCVKEDQVIGGEIIPIDATVLILAGFSSVSVWMTPLVVAGIAGLGVLVFRLRK